MTSELPRSGSPEVRKSGSPSGQRLITSLAVIEQVTTIPRESEVHETPGLPDFRTSGLGEFP
jgi:hypothetical protein